MAVILRSRAVLPINAAPIDDGAVVVTEDKITAVGWFPEMKAHYAGEVIDLGEQVLMPGLVNAHCHLDFSMMRHAIQPQRSFTEWIRRINAVKRSLSDDDYLAAIARGFAELRKWGTTTVANIESFPELLVRMPPPPIRTWWFLEMIDIRHRETSEEAVAGALSFFAERPEWLGGFGLSPHAPYTASTSLFELAGKAARNLGMPLTTHVAESREEWEMFRHGRGELYDFLLRLGRWMHDCQQERTPFGHVAAHASLDARWLLAHMNELDDADLQQLGRMPRHLRPSVVHCPGSHRYFRHGPFPLVKLLEQGVNVCLGTDSLASTESLSMFDEMRQMARRAPWLNAAEVLRMGTENGARALGMNAGKIEVGALADLIALPFRGGTREVYEAVLDYREPVAWMMLNGQLPPS
jgi:cytosine/adenosine deaminase-related metal-dependent hydrolase